MNLRSFFRLASLFLLFAVMSGHRAAACAACYSNNTGSKMGDAATWGIIAMTLIMFGMLGAIGGFAYYLSWRAKHPLPDYEELLREEDEHRLPDAS